LLELSAAAKRRKTEPRRTSSSSRNKLLSPDCYAFLLMLFTPKTSSAIPSDNKRSKAAIKDKNEMNLATTAGVADNDEM
jgi:hypothetical protein